MAGAIKQLVGDIGGTAVRVGDAVTLRPLWGNKEENEKRIKDWHKEFGSDYYTLPGIVEGAINLSGIPATKGMMGAKAVAAAVPAAIGSAAKLLDVTIPITAQGFSKVAQQTIPYLLGGTAVAKGAVGDSKRSMDGDEIAYQEAVRAKKRGNAPQAVAIPVAQAPTTPAIPQEGPSFSVPTAETPPPARPTAPQAVPVNPVHSEEELRDFTGRFIKHIERSGLPNPYTYNPRAAATQETIDWMNSQYPRDWDQYDHMQAIATKHFKEILPEKQATLDYARRALEIGLADFQKRMGGITIAPGAVHASPGGVLYNEQASTIGPNTVGRTGGLNPQNIPGVLAAPQGGIASYNGKTVQGQQGADSVQQTTQPLLDAAELNAKREMWKDIDFILRNNPNDANVIRYNQAVASGNVGDATELYSAKRLPEGKTSAQLLAAHRAIFKKTLDSLRARPSAAIPATPSTAKPILIERDGKIYIRMPNGTERPA